VLGAMTSFNGVMSMGGTFEDFFGLGQGGNIVCDQLEFLDDYDYESVSGLTANSGTYGLVGGGTFTWSVSGDALDWESTGALVYAVIIKGGPAARAYDYTPDGATSDEGLTAPINPNNGKPYGFSNLGFCYSPALMVEKTAKAEWTRTWDWEIEKTATPGGPVTLEVGDTATVEYDVKVSATSSVEFMVLGDITITNQTTNPITITSINDVISGGAGSDVVANDADITCTEWVDRTSSYVLPAGATLTCEYEVEVPAPDYTLNTVTVAAEGGMGGGATADFLFDTSKPTNEVDACVTVSDSNANFGVDKEVCVKNLDTEGVYAFTAYTVSFGYKADDVDVELVCGTQTYKNTATSTTIAGGVIDSSTVAIDMTVLCALDIEKTAKTEWTRTWDWNILKTATPGGLVTLAEGELATVDYTVAVSATSTLKFEVSGTVTVTNPHQSTVTVTGVKDVMTEYGSVALNCGAIDFDGGHELEGGASFTCSYSVVVDNPDSRINTATVEVASDSVVSGATATTSVKFDTSKPTTEVDACVTVSDSNANFGEDKEVCADGLTDGKKVYTYSVTFGKDVGANVELECGLQTYENTARVSKGDVVLAYSKVSIDMTVECALVCSWSQGYWFAKPGVVWPINIALGGNNYTQADGANIWNIKGRYAGSDAKVAFTQYTALVLSLEEQDGVDRTDLPTELQNALKVIEDYFDANEGKLSNSTIAKYSRSAAVRKAASDISAWIELNHCDYLVDDTNNY
jgi:hypothetical protein